MRSIGDLADYLAKVVPAFLHPTLYRRYFRRWEEHGFHLTPVSYSSPIPNLAALPESLWEQQSELIGMDMNDAGQLDLLQDKLSRFQAEFNQFSHGVGGDLRVNLIGNPRFAWADACVLYAMVRHIRPRQILEVGSGYSTRILTLAARQNGQTQVLCIDPYPEPETTGLLSDVGSLVDRPVQETSLDVFMQLEQGDVLFIDTSHIVRIGGDLPYLYLEVLPRLRPGVIVHIHDIFFPREYPKKWVMDELRFYSEQYLLHAFLLFNSFWEVLLCNSYLQYKYPQALSAAFPVLQSAPEHNPGSFWMRRKT
jgi:hypothetical protein